MTLGLLGVGAPSAAPLLTLAWEDPAVNEDGFIVERALDGSSIFEEIGRVGPNLTDYVDVTVTEGARYCYQVRSFNTFGASDPSNIDCAVGRELDAPALLLSVGLDQTVMTVTATLVPGPTTVVVDAYVVVALPDGRLFSIVGPNTIVPGIVPAARNLIPFVFSGELLRYTFSGGEPDGTYRWFAGLAHPGTTVLIGELAERSLVKSP